MTDTLRALCAELAEDLQCWVDINERNDFSNVDDTDSLLLINRARAALAQQPESLPYKLPEPVAPTDEEIGEWHDQCADLTRLGEVDHYWAFDLRSDEVAGVVRAALARWGTPANNTREEI